MILASLSIYFFSAKYRQQTIFDRLRSKARITSNLLLEAKMNPNLIEQMERNNPLKLNGERIVILNAIDDTVFSTDYDNEIKLSFQLLENIRSGRQILFKQGDYEVMGSLYSLENSRYVVLAAAIDSEGKQHLAKLSIILVIVCLVSIFIFTGAGWIYSGRALKPISDVIKKVDEISVTSLNLRINEGNGRDEIGRLTATFNRMLARLEKSFNVQKDFIANASHELRTPLTAISGQLEVLSLKDRTNDEYKSSIKSVLEDTRRIIDLANRLLLMARTSAEGPINFSNLRIDEILWHARDEIVRFNKNYRVNISMDDSVEDESQIQIKGNDSLIKVAFSNLIDNGCKYSGNNTVNVHLKSLPDSVVIVFSDDGIGIPENETPKVFEPFYRSQNAKKYPGTGIGLSIVKQIIENHNGTILLESKAGKGTEVTVSLPVGI